MNKVFAHSETISINVRDTPVKDIIQLIASYTPQTNVVVSPAIVGRLSFKLESVTPQDALALLLNTAHLGQRRWGNIILVAPLVELTTIETAQKNWQQLIATSKPVEPTVWQIRYSKASDIAKLLKDEQHSFISPKGQVIIDQRTNRLLVTDNKINLARIDHLIKKLDIPSKQILIKARLASIDHDFERDLGFEYAVLTKSKQPQHKSSYQTPVYDKKAYSIAVAPLANGSLLDIKLSALENAGHAELISSPSLITQNQQAAFIEAGEEVPYQEVSEGGGTATAFKKAVLGLKVTPQILPDHKILLQLQIKQDRPSTRLIQGVPTIITRELNTNVILKSGQTLRLGGIFEINQEVTSQGLPFLARVPFIGWLFKKQNTRKSKRELFIFVTPVMTE